MKEFILFLSILCLTTCFCKTSKRQDEELELVHFVNKNGNWSQGLCHCEIVTHDCNCRIRTSKDTFTNYRVDVVQAAFVVEDMRRQDSIFINITKDASDQRQWPPAAPFKFEDKRLGQLNGSEEPLPHLEIFPNKESEIGATFTLFYRNINSNTRPIALKSIKLRTNDTKSPQLPFTRVPAYNTRIESNDRVALCNKIFTLIHGFRGSADDEQFVDFKHALFQFHEYLHHNMACVLIIDWRNGAAATTSNYYAQAAANTIAVGRQTGLLFYQLVASRQISPSNIHMIGFSLGAHVAHFASKWYRNLVERTNTRQLSPLTGAAIGRITGLDPAARHFQGYTDAFLVKKDAAFVDIIHSSIVYHEGNFVDVLNSRYGIPDPIGDVDFYPNGGDAPQPGCSGKTSSCSHNRAIDYFIDSLNASLSRDARMAFPCEDYEHFDQCYQNQIQALGETRQVSLPFTSKNTSCMGIESYVFPGRGKMFLQYTPTHAGYYRSP